MAAVVMPLGVPFAVFNAEATASADLYVAGEPGTGAAGGAGCDCAEAITPAIRISNPVSFARIDFSIVLNRLPVLFLRLTRDERRMRLIPPVAVYLAIAAAAVPQSLSAQSAALSEGTIRGRVLDPDGQPMPDVQITVAEIVGDGFRNSRSITVRADGSFNIVVPAGRIRLMAQPRPKVVGSEPRLRRFVTHPPAYFPGVFDEFDAWPIDVKAGEIVELDFHMPPLPVGSIKTMVTGPDGYSIEHVRALRPEANQIKNIRIS